VDQLNAVWELPSQPLRNVPVSPQLALCDHVLIGSLASILCESCFSSYHHLHHGNECTSHSVQGHIRRVIPPLSQVIKWVTFDALSDATDKYG